MVNLVDQKPWNIEPTSHPLCGRAYKNWLQQQQFDGVPLQVEEPSVGLQNLGNMCFLNAVIQYLYHTPLLQRILCRICPNPTDDSVDEWIAALLQIFQHLDQARKRSMPVEATRIAALMLRASTNGEFMRGAQADAHEAFLLLISKLLNGCLPRDNTLPFTVREQLERSSTIGHTFGMDLEQVVRCNSCGEETRSVHSEYCLSISCTLDMSENNLKDLENEFAKMKKAQKSILPWRGSKKSGIGNGKLCPPATTVDSLMRAYFQKEQIHEWKCDKCSEKGCTRKTHVVVAPNTLSINVSRSHGSDFFGHVTRRVAFDDGFDLSQFLKPGAIAQSGDKSCQYFLFAVVVYRSLGDAGGHYVVYIKSRSETSNQWFLLDDKNVSAASWADVEGEDDFSLLAYASESVLPPKTTDVELKAAANEVDEAAVKSKPNLVSDARPKKVAKNRTEKQPSKISSRKVSTGQNGSAKDSKPKNLTAQDGTNNGATKAAKPKVASVEGPAKQPQRKLPPPTSVEAQEEAEVMKAQPTRVDSSTLIDLSLVSTTDTAEHADEKEVVAPKPSQQSVEEKEEPPYSSDAPLLSSSFAIADNQEEQRLRSHYEFDTEGTNVSAKSHEVTETIPSAMPGGAFHNASHTKADSMEKEKKSIGANGRKAVSSFPSLSGLVCCTSPYAGLDDDGEDPAVLVHDELHESSSECWIVLNHKAAL